MWFSLSFVHWFVCCFFRSWTSWSEQVQFCFLFSIQTNGFMTMAHSSKLSFNNEIEQTHTHTHTGIQTFNIFLLFQLVVGYERALLWWLIRTINKFIHHLDEIIIKFHRILPINLDPFFFAFSNSVFIYFISFVSSVHICWWWNIKFFRLDFNQPFPLWSRQWSERPLALATQKLWWCNYFNCFLAFSLTLYVFFPYFDSFIMSWGWWSVGWYGNGTEISLTNAYHFSS